MSSRRRARRLRRSGYRPGGRPDAGKWGDPSGPSPRPGWKGQRPGLKLGPAPSAGGAAGDLRRLGGRPIERDRGTTSWSVICLP